MAGRSSNAFVLPFGSLRPPRLPRSESHGFLHLQQTSALPRRTRWKRKGSSGSRSSTSTMHHGNGTEDMFRPTSLAQAGTDGEFSFSISLFTPYIAARRIPAPNSDQCAHGKQGSGRRAAVKKAVETQWLAGLGELQAADDFHLGRIRRTQGRSAGGHGAGRKPTTRGMTRELKQLAARHSQGRMVSMLEGGTTTYPHWAAARSPMSGRCRSRKQNQV